MEDNYELLVRKDLEGNDHDLFQGTILAFPCTSWMKAAGYPTEIRSGQLPNPNVDHCC